MTAAELNTWRERGNHTLIDVRLGRAYSEGHIPGALSAPFRQQGWARPVAAWIKQQGLAEDVGLFGDNPVVVRAAAEALEAAGVTVAVRYDSGLTEWTTAGYPVVSVRNLTVDELAGNLADWTVIDVREPYELRSGVVPGAQSIPMNRLEQQAPNLPTDARYAIICASGNRSQAAAAYLAEQGLQVATVVGGMSLWLGGGHPTERA